MSLLRKCLLKSWICLPAFLLMGAGHGQGEKAAAEVEKAAQTVTKEMKEEAAEATTYQFLVDQSKLNWKGTKVVGDSHEGDLMVKTGFVTYHGDKPHSAEVVMDMNTINCTDMKGRSKKKLDKHLKNEDFFDVPNHPTAKLVVSSFTHLKENSYELSGNITIRGTTKPITFTSELVKGETLKGSGSFQFDRTEFNVKYNSKKFFPAIGDKIINDAVELSFNFVAAMAAMNGSEAKGAESTEAAK